MDIMDNQAKNMAFASAVLINLCSQFGVNFLMPLVTPFGKFMDASNQQIANWGLVRGLCLLLSTVWLSKLSDSTSRRLAVTIALIGSGVGYYLQAIAADYKDIMWWLDTNAGVWIFTAGRAVGGLFAGTQPVLRAFVAEIYIGDPVITKQKLVTLQVFQQAVGLALSPIAGSISRFNIALPFWITVGASVFGILWTLAYFPQIRKAPTPADASSAELVTEAERPLKSPYKDITVLMLTLAFVFMVTVFMGAIGLLLPGMLYEGDSFGLNQGDKEEVAGRISQVLGLLILPFALVNVMVSIFLYARVTERFGEARCIFIAGLIIAAVFPCYGFATELWHIVVLNCFGGSGFGIVMPSIGPMMARYAEGIYPQQRAQVQAVPLMGSAVGMMIGQNICAYLWDTQGLKSTWAFMGIFMLIATMLIVSGSLSVDRALARSGTQALQKSVGKDPDDFLAATLQAVQESLTAKKDKLWSHPLQALVALRVLNLVPELPEWKDETQGEEYLRSLWDQLEEFGPARDEYRHYFQNVVGARETFVTPYQGAMEGVVQHHLVGNGGSWQSRATHPRSTELKQRFIGDPDAEEGRAVAGPV